MAGAGWGGGVWWNEVMVVWDGGVMWVDREGWDGRVGVVGGVAEWAVVEEGREVRGSVVVVEWGGVRWRSQVVVVIEQLALGQLRDGTGGDQG